MTQTIAFIGGGNIAYSLISGLIKNNFPKEKIWVSNPGDEKRQQLKTAFNVNITANNRAAIEAAGIVIFCVKPQVITTVLNEATEVLKKHKPLIISVLAGVKISSFQKWVGNELSIIRAMPNTPAVLGCGITALYANSNASPKEKSLAEHIMRAVGNILWLDDEEKINAATAIAGSGPAYFFLVMEALQIAAKEIGLEKQEAHILVLQTALGAAKMALESTTDVDELRRQVTSPKGTTEAAIKHLEAGGIIDLFKQAVVAANKRAEELSKIIT